ncbi:hypothetical protein [Telmatospirillum sp. J64-1]|uniref:hypothetical protein n=1 Tax=Telmatospirillum sp. J64-1 TaxID=2502183 RepID=UPI00115CF467|nr:hypothetical protein [Telmatospirillum sp. J64-1]
MAKVRTGKEAENTPVDGLTPEADIPGQDLIAVGETGKLDLGRIPQLDMFDSLLPTNKPHPYINSFALFDLAPKYVWTVTSDDYLKREGKAVEGVLAIKSRQFEHEGIAYEIVITPARFTDENGAQVEAFPSHQEQVLEDVLRRLAITKRRTTMINSEPGVKFTFYELRAELKAIGSTMSLQEIKRAIEICHKCSIGIRRIGEKEPDFSAPIFPSRALAKRLEDGDTISYVTFHPLVAAALMRMEYRLLNYETNVKFKGYVSKWLHKRLSHRYCQASITDRGYTIKATTIVRDSGMTQYKQWRDTMRKVREAVEELKTKGVLLSYRSEDIKGSNGRLEDIIFTLMPSLEFSQEQKAVNYHQNQLAHESEKRGLRVVKGGKDKA